MRFKRKNTGTTGTLTFSLLRIGLHPVCQRINPLKPDTKTRLDLY